MFTVIGTIIFWIFTIAFGVGCLVIAGQFIKKLRRDIEQKMYYGPILVKLRQQRPR